MAASSLVPHALATRGPLIAIGGAEDRTSDLAVLNQVFSRAPAGNAEVAVIATASSIPGQILPIYQAAFERLGASQVHTLAMEGRRQAADGEIVRLIERSGVIFFTGGDQLRLTHVMGGSPALKAIRARLRAGAVVAGTSAGAAALPSTMIYNSTAEDALRKGAVKMAAGFGLVDGVIIDTHFLERGRFSRLMEVGATNPDKERPPCPSIQPPAAPRGARAHP